MDRHLQRIVTRQREVLAELEQEVKKIESSDLTKENEQLKVELARLNEAYLKAEQTAKILSDQNASMKNALYEQAYNEKVKLVNSSKEKLEIYFKGAFGPDRLTLLENNIRARIDHMAAILQRNHVDIRDEIYQKLNELSVQLNGKVTEAQRLAAKTQGAFSEQETAEFESLKQEQITPEQLLAVTKKNNVERFVGLNLFNIIGIVLIVIGVITASRYTYLQLPVTLKGMMIFALGAVMLIAGEIMNRKKPNIFSLGITAGGVGVLYVALATSYFGLKILTMYPALAICVLITGATFLLSTRYHSQTILSIALVGGYLPIFSIGTEKSMIYGAMVYFVVLNLLALLVSFQKKWSISSFIGLGLNLVGTISICLKINSVDTLAAKVITILYLLFAFLNYTMIPIVSTYINQLNFRKRDVVLLGINTFFSSMILYLMFYEFHWQDFTGLLAIIFAAIYLLLGGLIEKKFVREKNTQALFYLTGLAFVILIIPFQFGRAWLTLGWLAEGVAITVYGILKDEKTFKRAGFAINGLCLWAFLFFDVSLQMNHLFAYKYLAITLGSLILLGAYLYKKTLSSQWQKGYKYAVILNLWFYCIYIFEKMGYLLYQAYPGMGEIYSISYLVSALTIVTTFFIAFVAPRIKMLSDLGTKIIAIALDIIGILWLLALNGSNGPIRLEEPPLGIIVVGTIVLAIVGLLAVFAMQDMVKLIVMERKLGVQWYPLIVSSYFVVILTQTLITQYHLSFASAWISIIYVVTALLWIVFGFTRRYSLIRKFGLGLALLAVVKLFLIDLLSLTKGYQIVSYFALGITLVTISFVYQYFNKRLELKLEVTGDASENF